MSREKILRAISDDTDPTIFYNDSRQFHREDGPAYQTSGGYKSWWIHGKRHREDGPAIEYPTGEAEWWYNDQPIPVSNLEDFQSYLRNKAFW